MKKSAQRSFVYKPEDSELKRRLEEGSLSINNAIRILSQAEQQAIQALPPESSEDNIQALLQEMDSLIGLNMVKGLVSEIRAYVEISKRRRLQQLKCEGLVLHMVFKGNPGTGKTTIARILGHLLAELQVLPKGHLVEVERADLVGEYIGHTAQKTRDQLRKALGGILFIDEAYSLARGGEKDFGKEAIDTLVKAMEDHKNELILILAGYRHEMDKFMRTNPGLKSRFPIQIHFPDYTTEELLDISLLMLSERQYCLSNAAQDYLIHYLKTQTTMQKANFSNARLVRNLIERAIRKQALRLMQLKSTGRKELMQIEVDDLMIEEGDGGEEWSGNW